MDEAHELDALLVPFLDDEIKLVAVRFISGSGHAGSYIKVKVVNMFSVGAAKDTSGLWDLRSDSLADSRENVLGDNVGFRFFFVCHFLPP